LSRQPAKNNRECNPCQKSAEIKLHASLQYMSESMNHQ